MKRHEAVYSGRMYQSFGGTCCLHFLGSSEKLVHFYQTSFEVKTSNLCENLIPFILTIQRHKFVFTSVRTSNVIHLFYISYSICKKVTDFVIITIITICIKCELQKALSNFAVWFRSRPLYLKRSECTQDSR
jgi:hypothetical protein